MREDVYGVFVGVQDEEQAQLGDYESFSAAICSIIKDQLRRRQQIDAHLASKVRIAG